MTPVTNKRWKLTFATGATREVSAPTLFDAKYKVLSAVGAARLPRIISVVLIESAEEQLANKVAAAEWWARYNGEPIRIEAS